MGWTLQLLLLSVMGEPDARHNAQLLGHWPLRENAAIAAGEGGDGKATGVTFADKAAAFDGNASAVELQGNALDSLGAGDFTISFWAEFPTDQMSGDLLTKYDPLTGRGLGISIVTRGGVGHSLAGVRQLEVTLCDGEHAAQWVDRGRPGNAVYVMALAAHDDALYAGTCESGPGERGHVYRQGPQWEDLGSPDESNAVISLASFDGKLFAGTGKYRLAGSALPESPNAEPGGRVLYLNESNKWVDCGKVAEETVGGLVVFQGKLYASSLYKPAAFMRYEGGTSWTSLPLPPGNARVEAMIVYRDQIFATTYDGGSVFRFDGQMWHDAGQLEDNTQTYSFAIYQGQLFVGSWPSGKVYRYVKDGAWDDCGRLGEELEVMGMAVYGPHLYAGTLPLAQVYRYEGGDQWALTGRLDMTADVKYRRAWSMAVYKGALWCGTLPSGRVHSLTTGSCVTVDRAFPADWQQVTAVRRGNTLQLFLNGKLAATLEAGAVDASNKAPLVLGSGHHQPFRGRMRDLRIYRRAMDENEIRAIAGQTF